MQNNGLDRPKCRHKDRPTAAEVEGQSPLGAAPDLAVPWTDFNGELRAPDDAKKAEEDRKMSMMFPRIQPDLRCPKWWLVALHPPPALCTAVACRRPAV